MDLTLDYPHLCKLKWSLCNHRAFNKYAHALGGVTGVASFITTDEQLQSNRGCCFLVQAMLPEGFPFHQFNDSNSYVISVLYQMFIETNKPDWIPNILDFNKNTTYICKTRWHNKQWQVRGFHFISPLLHSLLRETARQQENRITYRKDSWQTDTKN